MAKLETIGLPFAPISKPHEMFDDPHLNAGGGLLPLTIADGEKKGAAMKLPALPVEIGGTRPGVHHDVPRQGQENWMPLFVVLREGAELDDDLRKQIAKRVREDCSPRHVPDEVHAVKEIPRTLSGKVLEVPVKKILMGTDPDKAASRDSLANPAALDPFVELASA